MMLTSIGDRVEAGSYRLHSRFDRAANFERDARLVSVVAEDIGPGPVNIVLRGFEAGSERGSRGPLEVGTRAVVFEGRRFSLTKGHRFRSTLPLAGADPVCFHQNVRRFGEFLRESAPQQSLAFLLDDKAVENSRPGFERAFRDQVRRNVREILHGDLLEGVRGLKGCGSGLTPSGDDFIAGLLFGLAVLEQVEHRDCRALADAVAGAARGGNVFSNTFLDLARQGLVFGRMRDLIIALAHRNRNGLPRQGRKRTGSRTLGGGDPQAGARTDKGLAMPSRGGTVALCASKSGVHRIENAAAELLAIGGSSGADLATGFCLTISSFQWSRTEAWWQCHCPRHEQNRDDCCRPDQEGGIF
jgi:hypothetical protein